MGYEIWASKIGFEFDNDVLIKIDREPGNEAEWDFVSEFISANFPLTSDDISHGFSQTSCNVILPIPICFNCRNPMTKIEAENEPVTWECNCGTMMSYTAFPSDDLDYPIDLSVDYARQSYIKKWYAEE